MTSVDSEILKQVCSSPGGSCAEIVCELQIVPPTVGNYCGRQFILALNPFQVILAGPLTLLGKTMLQPLRWPRRYMNGSTRVEVKVNDPHP
jgi:hypothetical protein